MPSPYSNSYRLTISRIRVLDLFTGKGSESQGMHTTWLKCKKYLVTEGTETKL